MTVRTRAFKEWFGDWEKAARIEKLRDSVSVEISGREIEEGADIKSYRKNAKEYGSRLRGTYLNRDTGKRIAISMSGINEVLSHDASPSQFKSIAAIPQMVENGIYIESRENEDIKKHPDVGSYDYFVCGLKIGGADYTAKIVVANQRNGERYYDHKLTQIEKGALLSTLSAIHKAGEESNTPLSEVKDKRLLSILQANSSKVVDGNGEPLVVYHGTDADFTVFDRAKIGSSTNNKGMFGNGFYMTDDSSYASYYNRSDGRMNKDGRGKVMPLFVSLKNPFDWNAPDAARTAESLGFPKSRIKDSKLLPLTEERQILSFTENLKKSGHDGVVFTFDDGTREFVAFEPEQIKSATENVGTFDAGNPDIRYSLGGGARVLRAWHGSPHAFAAEEGAPFGRFGLSFVGTGEGAQAFGYGIYLTSEEDIARHNYAQRLGDDDTAAAQRALGRFGLAWATFRADELAACVSFADFKRELRAAAWSLEDLVEEGEMTAEELASDKASIREATKTREAFDALLSAMLATQDYFYESRREDIERALEEAGEGRKAKALREELERFDELKREADANERPRHHLYEARIRVADDASNLLDWVARPSEEQLERIRAGLRERGVSEEAAVRLTAAGSFGEIYRGVSEELGGAAKASETLKAAGFAGHKYTADSVGTGAADYSRGTNYVIYDTGATEITDAVRWLRNDSGVVYGYWDEGSGELHLNEDFADFDTPLHEWAHVWLLRGLFRGSDARRNRGGGFFGRIYGARRRAARGNQGRQKARHRQTLVGGLQKARSAAVARADGP